MTLNMIQNLGIISTISFDWPDLMSYLVIFTLDMDGLGYECISRAPSLRYALSVCIFPVILVLLTVSGVASQFHPRPGLRWVRAKTLNTMGQFMQLSFTTLVNVAVAPLMCYSHPNGTSSIRRYRGVLCWESEHVPFIISGCLLLLLALSFYAWIVTAAIRSPKKAAEGNMDFIAMHRFLLFRFREDVWWFGVLLLVRGPLLSLSAVVATNYPILQVIFMVTVLLVICAVQLLLWPWKAPILNLIEVVVNILVVILLVTTMGYAPEATGDLRIGLLTLSWVILMMIFAVLAGMIVIAIVAVVRRGPMGSTQDSRIFMLCKLPDVKSLADKLQVLSGAATSMSTEELAKDLNQLSVYDLQTTMRAITVLRFIVASTDSQKELFMTKRLSLVSSLRKSVVLPVVQDNEESEMI